MLLPFMSLIDPTRVASFAPISSTFSVLGCAPANAAPNSEGTRCPVRNHQEKIHGFYAVISPVTSKFKKWDHRSMSVAGPVSQDRSMWTLEPRATLELRPKERTVKWTKSQIRRLVEQMRQQRRTDDEIADEIRHRCGWSPLASYRHLHGWSQSDVADRYRAASSGPLLDQAGLSRLELWPKAGGRAPQANQIIALASLYRTTPLRLLTPEGMDALDAHERNVLLRVSDHNTPPKTSCLPEHSAVRGIPFPRVENRPITPESQVEMSAQRAMRFGALAEGSNTGPETVQQIFEEVSRISSVYPRIPLTDVLGDLIEAQEAAFLLLEGRQRPSQTRDLYLLGGLLSIMLAKASHDMGGPESAMKQARTAYICADNAEHDGLRIRVRAQQSLMAYWAGWTSEAARYADLARGLADAPTGSAGVWLMAQSARTRASVGDGERALADLRKATELRENLEPDDLDALGGLMHFAHCRQLYYGAETRIWLPGQEEETKAVASEAVRAYEAAADSSSDDWAYGDEAGSRADLAYALASLGEVEGAAEALAPVLQLPAKQRIAGIIGSVERVQSTLRRPSYAGSPKVERLRQEIDAYGRGSTAITSGQ